MICPRRRGVARGPESLDQVSRRAVRIRSLWGCWRLGPADGRKSLVCPPIPRMHPRAQTCGWDALLARLFHATMW